MTDNTSSRIDRARQWSLLLAKATSVFVVAMTLSGLSIWVLPFSRSNQMIVFAHTLLGVVFFLPVSYYLVRHWLTYRGHLMTHIKLAGYAGLFVLALANVSGMVLTFQALFGTRISYSWDAVHIVTTFAVIAFVAPHVLAIVFRDRRAHLAGIATAFEAARSHGRAVLLVSLTVGAGLALVVYAYEPVALTEELPPDYSYAYGTERPFAPSLALTETGKAYDTRLLSGSRSCGTAGCHEEIFAEWQVSAHRYAAMDAAFQSIQLNMAEQNGPNSTRYCGGCHDPISLFSGTKNLFTDPAKLTGLAGYDEGVSCLSCHAVREVDVQGNANYVMGRPTRYLLELEYDEHPSPVVELARNFLIRAYPREHVSSLGKTLFKAPEYCAACHKQFVDQEINRVGWVQLQNQYDNWRKSRWNHPDEPTKTIECRECHMPLVASSDPASGDEADYNRSASDAKHRSHRFLGANQMMPALLELPGWEQHVALIEAWLKGEIAIPEIADKWSQGAAVGIELVTPEAVRPGDTIPVQVVITSNKVGHDYPTGPLDIIQSWVELVVTNDAGEVVFSSGTVGEDGFIEPGSFIFKAEPVDQFGNLIDRHNLWEMVGVRHRRALFPGFSDTASYDVACPDLSRVKKSFPEGPVEIPVAASEAPGRLHVRARLLYRKVDQYLLNFMYGSEKGLTSPVTEMAHASREIEVAAGER
ncbi:MAG TPA: multiheme c-type cytochrome [Vicinamibacteria bacterium]|nr:multiheme c-type cytochrome [Vicinamibacteria bacterium]